MKLKIGWMKRVLIVTLVLIAMAGAPSRDFSTISAASAADTTEVVELTVEQADSLSDLLVNQQFEIDSLRVVIWRKDQVAHADSVLNAELLALYKQDREHWLVRSIKHPALWFCVGIYAGLYATR